MKPPITKRDYDKLLRKQWRDRTDAEFFAEIKAARELKAQGKERGYVFPALPFISSPIQ